MALDIHGKPFHSGTQTKLEIFERYLMEWIPVFIKDPHCTEVNIIDFFAGSGTDSLGNHGSPLLIIDVLDKFRKQILDKKLKVNIIVNERKKDKFNKLSDVLDNQKRAKIFNIVKHNRDFSDLFTEIKESIRNTPNLIFIDQYGVKQVSQGVFIELCNFKKTDFLFFMSSSYVKRFNKRPEFKNYLGWMGENAFDGVRTHEVHQVIASKYRELVKTIPEMQLIPFTIKKEQNVYGLIFCCKHILGADKFLQVAWKINSENGNANFDIEDDDSKAQMDFLKPRQLKKLEKFDHDLEQLIEKRSPISNMELYKHTISTGFLPKHAKDAVKKLRDSGILEHFSHAYIGYKPCYIENKVVQFRKKLK